jgi:DedD protein
VSNALQNRLVGTVILVAVIVIFLPDYLDGKKETNSDAFVDFPRSTTNLSASEPDAFPADKVAEATRRNVVIESSGESDAERTSTGSANQSANDGAAKKDTGVNAAADARVNDSSSTSVQGSVQSNAAKPALEKAAEPASTEISAPVSKSPANSSSEPSSQVSSETSSQLLSGARSKPSPQTLPALPPKAAQAKTVLQDSGWVVQLGVFRNKKNVNELQTKLEKAGYRAFSREVETAAGRLTKVFVGPELERNKLDKALNHLYEISGAKGKVTSFEEATN